jgi:pullulanase-type alpha-1,6-glucosidase
LQDEAGCPGEWQPDCAATHLTESPTDGVWRGDFSLPAGAFEYKAALNDSWDENYGAGGVANGPNIALGLGAGTDVRFYYDHASHWITDNVNSVIASAPGDYQAAIGCPGDWQPDCLLSWLQDLDGDGIYEFTTSAIPAGAYQFKVAINESWDENYGAGGTPDGDNIPFTVSAGDTVTFVFDSATNIPDVTVEPAVSDEDLVRPALRHPFQDEVLYFAIPDRFNDGDTGNNCGDYGGPCVVDDTQENVLTHGYLPADRGYYHGGDIAGLHDQLDYLENLGITAIWVGPVFKNRTVQPDSTNLYGYSSGYHGYWIEDFLEVDPHLGTNAEFEALVDDAHSRGIQVFMDIITNHTADVVQLEGNAGYRNKTDFPYRDVNGDPFDDSEFAYYGQADYTFPEVDESSFPYVPVVPPGEETTKNPGWLNDPFLYHNRGDSGFAGENSLYGDFFGLDDLWTERKEVVDGMIDIYSFWIEEFGVDGFRIDTTKHVNMEFWQKFGPDILAAAEAQGIDHFFAFGEVFDQQFGPRFLSEFSTTGQLQSTIDFAFQEAARDFASVGGATNNLRDFFAADDYYTDADSNAYAMPTFVGNHDMGRIGYFLQRVDQPAADDAELLARSTLAQALMFFSRGQPVIYYGDEQGFVGDGGDKLARQDMFANAVPEYEDDDLIGTDATTSDDNFDPTHPIYQSLADYAAAYQARQGLRSGAQIHRVSSDGPGVYAFSRIDRDEQVEYVVAFNNAETETAATVPTFYESGVAFDLVVSSGGAAATAATDTNGDLPVTVAALGFVVYAASAPVAPSAAAPGISITTLTDGEAVVLAVEDLDGHEVMERIEVGADLDADVFAEVTFAVSVDGAAYTPIGTDDNAPYRVFYDATGLEGVPLSFKAIVNDLNGHVASATVANVVATVEEPPPPGAASYAIVHYFREDGDYGDHTTGDFTDYWGLHLWGDIEETIDWTAPKPFLGEDEYGRFAWVKLAPGASNVGFIVHRGDVKDGTDQDRFFDPSVTPEIWLKGGDGATYASQAAAQGYATIRYHRDDGDYGDPTSPDFNDFWGLHLWGDAIDPTEGTDWTDPKRPDGEDDYGLFWNVLLQDPTAPLNYIIHRGDEKDPGPDQSFVPADHATVWIQSGDETIYEQRGAAEGVATIHYHRPAGDYGDYTSDNFNDFWGMHVWTGAADPNPSWQEPVKPVDFDTFGPVFEVGLVDGADQLAYILHRGDEKDPGPDQFLVFAENGYEVWQLSGADPEDPYILPLPAAPGNVGDLTKQQAHWVSADTIVWAAAVDATATYELWYSENGTLELVDDGTVTGGDSIPLELSGVYPSDVDGRLHLGGLPTLTIAGADLALVPDILTGQMAVVATSTAGVRFGATGLQIPGVLDDLYAYAGDLGVVWDGDVPTIRVWAPTAQDVALHLFDDADPGTAPTPVEMTRDDDSGTWSATGDAGWNGKYYLYEVEVYAPATGQVETNLVTDPYSVSLSMNSARSQIVDLGDAALQPAEWDDTTKPGLVAPEDIVIYELHVRDFSVDDTTVDEPYRGTYKAFTEDSDGMAHLTGLAEAGLTHLHLLPVFDIATINENKAEWQAPDPAELATYPPDSEEQQAAVTATADIDGFNWGYDPWHYTTPEGSYSTNPDGSTRVVEFREMVQSLNERGLRVVMDVVYNHTNASGQAEKSVLDRIVPGYYHRLNADGVVETSTCCANTATEHAMMEKLMIDSVVTWARDYKVDGFRFDLMGHHSKVNMLNVRAALDALTLAGDGVDGSAIYLYGEGWNFGEVADNARFEQATQLNMGGSGIGTFNDRIRDAIRGGGPFDGGDGLVLNQGYVNGVYYDPNELVVSTGVPEADRLAELLLSADQIRVGLAGNLADYEFVDRNGNVVPGSAIDYNGAPSGYTEDPQEHISYASAHDNQTLFDVGQYHHPVDTPMADRVRAQNVAMDVTALSQGVPFFHAGVDMLRSKSFDRDSFNSGDWFNSLDFTYATTNWGNGVPVAEKNEADWELMKPYLANPDLAPLQGDVEASVAHLREILEVRKSSPLFRLQTEDEIMSRVAFHNTGADQVPGLIVMSISDTAGDDLDGEADGMWALFNPTDDDVAFTVADLTGADVVLHSALAGSVDPIVQTSSFDASSGAFFVPARTTAVFVQLEPDTAPPEIDAELVPLDVFRRTGRFEVDYSCTDDRDPDPVTVADLNGIEVEDGTRVFLITTQHKQRHRWVEDTLFVWAPSFELTVTCTDEAGNTATVTVEPEFGRRGPWRGGVLE